MPPLPNVRGMLVALDTEGSGLFTDDGARISAVSCAWRDPATSELIYRAWPFDQGLRGQRGDPAADLPCGPKIPHHITPTHARRVDKWDPADQSAPNLPIAKYRELLTWASQQRLIMQHMKFDQLMSDAGLRSHEDSTGCDLERATTWDTMLMAGILDPREPTGLKPTSVRLHLGESLGLQEGEEDAESASLDPWKGPRNDPRFDLIPWRVLRPYAALDAALTYLDYEHQLARLEGEPSAAVQRKRQFKTEMDLSRVLLKMERRAVLLDVEGMRGEDRKLLALIDEARALVPFRPTYPGAQKHFFGPPASGDLGLLPFSDKLTKSGAPQVDEEVIGRLVAQDAPGAREFQNFAELKAAHEKWYGPWPAMVGSDSRLRTCHRQMHVISGRLSTERWQAQAMPHDYLIPKGIRPPKDFLGGDPGYTDYEIDMSQAEIRVATALAKCTPMLRQFKLGYDSHDAASLLMFYPGQDMDKARSDTEWIRFRQVAKRCNLGILYGIGAKGLKVQIAKFTGMDVSTDDTRGWISDYRRAFPPFSRALDESADIASRFGEVRLIDGSVRPFSDYEPVHKAFNQRVQGSVAIAMKLAMIDVEHEFPGLLLLQIHDSLVLRIPHFPGYLLSCGHISMTDYRDARIGSYVTCSASLAHQSSYKTTAVATPEHVVQRVQAIMSAHFSKLFAPVPFRSDASLFGKSAVAAA